MEKMTDVQKAAAKYQDNIKQLMEVSKQLKQQPGQPAAAERVTQPQKRPSEQRPTA